MQMRAPYKDTIQKIFIEIIVFLSSPRARTAGPKSFDNLAKGYAELSRVCNGNNLEDIFTPITTLAPEYLGVPDVNGLLRSDYEISSPDAEVDSPVLANCRTWCAETMMGQTISMRSSSVVLCVLFVVLGYCGSQVLMRSTARLLIQCFSWVSFRSCLPCDTPPPRFHSVSDEICISF
ncbi:hypothetical protein PSPO01_16505 [Paraphaeosphaeria sporulosa]